MGKIHAHGNGSFGPYQVFSAQGTTAEVSLTLEVPCRRFTLHWQKGSTNATLNMVGHLAASSLSTAGAAIFTLAATSSTGGTLTSTESTGPYSRLTFNHAAGASTGGLNVWVAGTPS